MTLLERSTLLNELRSRLACAAEGRGSVLLLQGEAGIGKSALVQTFAAQTNLRVLWSACEDLATPEALGPMRDWARDAEWRWQDDLKGRLGIFSRTLSALRQEITLAVIEDVHWADDATLDLIRFLGRRIAGLPVMLLLTARDDDHEARQRLRRALVQVPANDRISLNVPRLSREAVYHMASKSQRDGEVVFEVTGGNPFFVVEILNGGETIPPTVRDAVLAQFDRLPPSARRAVEAAAVFPRRVEHWLLCELCQDHEPGSIDTAVAAGFLVEEPDSYAFRHEVARKAIEEAIPHERLTALNRSALEALRRVPETALARLVHHADAAGEAAAVRTFAPRAAVEASRVGAHREAARHYATALKHSNSFEAGEQASLYEQSAFELHLVGRIHDAIAAQRRSVELRRLRGERLAEGNGLRWLSRLHYLNGERHRAERCALEALGVLSNQPAGSELAMTYSNLGQLAMLQDDSDAAVKWGARAAELAIRLDRSDILSHTLNNTGTARRWIDPSAARSELARSLDIALENDLPEHAARAYTNAAYVELGWRDNARAAVLLDAGIAFCEAHDLETWRSYMSGCLAERLMREGKWNEAAAIAYREISSEGATGLIKFPALLALARIRLRRGDPDAATLIDEIRHFLAGCMDTPRFLSYVGVMAERSWLSGADTEDAAKLLREAYALALSTSDYWAIGELSFWGRKLGVSELHHARAADPYRLLGDGSWAEAAKIWLDLGAPFERALALCEGDMDAQHLGLTILDEMGALAVSDRLRKEMREAGMCNIPRGPHASTRANPAGLTRRQMDVLKLLDEGLANVAIAERLFVSPKTVDHHVSAILAKLNARSRGEAAAIGRTQGLLDEQKKIVDDRGIQTNQL